MVIEGLPLFNHFKVWIIGDSGKIMGSAFSLICKVKIKRR